MKRIIIFVSLLFSFLFNHAQTNKSIREFKSNRINQNQKNITFDTGVNFSNSGNEIYYKDSALWKNKPALGLNIGISMFQSKQGKWIKEGQFVFNIERQQFDSRYFSSILIINYNYLLGYRLTNSLSIKAGVGAGIITSIVGHNPENPLYMYKVDELLPIRFKSELTILITPKIFFAISWTSVFEKLNFNINQYETLTKYNSMLFSADLKFCLSNKQKLIQNNNQYLKFCR